MNSPIPRSFGFSPFDRLFGYLDTLRPLDRLLIGVLSLIFITTTAYNLFVFTRSFLVEVPVSGGTLIEGAIGSPRFINPVLAITRADHDLMTLTYSGLMRLSPEGELVNELAESITVSEDGRVYNVVLRDDRRFHDGVKVTADDVAYTIALIQKPSLKSPIRGNWSGVTVEVINNRELNLVLENPYMPFKENLTLGIMPKHVWQTLTDEEFPFSQHNIEPIGSGPYKVAAIKRSAAGLVSEYQLVPADNNGITHIKHLIVRYYQNEEEIVAALRKHEITSTAALGERWLTGLDRDKYRFVSEPLPRVFSIFFNQNKTPVLRDAAVRNALNAAIDRQALVHRAVNDFGLPAYSPLPANWIENISTTEATSTPEERLAEATNILTAGGWTRNQNGRWEKQIDGANVPLIITIRSANGDLFEKMAGYLTETWQTLGVEVNFEFYEQSDLVQTIIRPRDYQALLFGMDIGRSLDLYPFWHSGSREDPGLNVSLYANITVDRLVGEIRTSTSTAARDGLIERFISEIEKERPAIFLFTPTFEYVTATDLTTSGFKRLQRQSERFSNVDAWYMDQSRVWPIFAKEDMK